MILVEKFVFTGVVTGNDANSVAVSTVEIGSFSLHKYIIVSTILHTAIRPVDSIIIIFSLKILKLKSVKYYHQLG